MRLSNTLRGADDLVAEAGAPTLDGVSRAALERLVDGYRALPLTRVGRFLAERNLVAALARRARVAASVTRDLPKLASPVFVASPFRSGTTLLHRMLATSPDLAALAPWETAYAPPPLGDPGGYEGGRRARVALGIEHLRRASPDLFRLHPTSLDAPDECLALLETSLLSPSFTFHAAPSGYASWLAAQDPGARRGAYDLYVGQLRVIAAWRGARRFVLKSASHLDGLGALLEAMPDARVVQLHREPVGCVTSLARLYAAHHALYLPRVDLRAIGHLAVDSVRAGLDGAVRARLAAPAAAFLDVDFESLRRDPAGVAARVLAFADADGSIDDLRRAADANPAPTPRADEPTTGDFGLDRDEIRAVFAAYDALSR